MREKIINIMKEKSEDIKQQFKYLKKHFNITIASIIAIALFIITPDKFYYAIFFIVFYYALYKAFEKIANIQHILAIDFKNNEVALFEISQARLNEYNIYDEAMQPSTLKYTMKAKKTKVFIADAISSRKNIIVLNPLCSNLEFIKDYKDIDMKLKEELNKLQHENIELKSKLEYATLQKASEIYEKHPILNLLKEDNGVGK